MSLMKIPQSVRCIFSKTFYFLAPFHPHFAVTKVGEVPECFTMGQSIALKSPAISAALPVLLLADSPFCVIGQSSGMEQSKSCRGISASSREGAGAVPICGQVALGLHFSSLLARCCLESSWSVHGESLALERKWACV